jgi:hypothetical protein
MVSGQVLASLLEGSIAAQHIKRDLCHFSVRTWSMRRGAGREHPGCSGPRPIGFRHQWCSLQSQKVWKIHEVAQGPCCASAPDRSCLSVYSWRSREEART